MSTARSSTWSGPAPDEVVVVGVHAGQDLRVVDAAAGLARRLAAGLVAVWVDPTRVVVRRETDGTLDLTPVDPDDDDVLGQVTAADELAERIGQHLAADGPTWRFVYAAGEVAHELAAVVAQHSTAYVVVGSRRPGLAGWMNEAIGGSIAGRLAHTQAVPVVVVPLPGERR
ncbi:universal stress protein [Cellulomonas sp. PhB150]|uniref:universal stress protein n=1 Tax=Cellulomonas sp. PhB150 TaxID=2485188 RepID=UPI000F461AB2|nr:universal stress protein [Cellulomonas sp. PhB150]ROS30583.1 universal stress protein family protein [Cellulomonas sp. PhB150]